VKSRHRRYPLTWSAPFDTSKENLRPDVAVCRPAQRTDGARGVQIAQGNVLIGDQMDSLVGTTWSSSRWRPDNEFETEKAEFADTTPLGAR
jgi:hypothetical protein